MRSRAARWCAPGVVILAAMLSARAVLAFAPPPPASRLAIERWCALAFDRPAAGTGVSLEVVDARTVRGVLHVLVARRWQGLRVLPERMRFSFAADGPLLLASGAFTPLPSELPPAAVAPSEARATAARALPDRMPRECTAEPVVLADGSGVRRGWRVAGPEWPGLPEASLLVDAVSGEFVGEESPVLHAVCYVNDPDPRSGLAERDLPWLSGDGSALVTPWMVVEGPQQNRLTRPGGDYRVVPTDPDTTGFDDANAAWHVSHYLHGFLADLGYEGPPDTIIVRVRQPIDPYVAVTSGRYVLLGNPIPGFSLDAAKAADLMLHEATHAVLLGYGIQGTGDRREASALHEGIADYMAAAATADPGVGEWLYVSFPSGATRVDAPATQFRYENYDRVSFGAAPTGSSWANGMILSGALWDLRSRIGRTADSLVLEALPYLQARPTWADLADALALADGQWHGAANAAAIATALTGRGIRGLVALTLSGPDHLAPGATATYRASLRGIAAGTTAWFARDLPYGEPPRDWVPLGSGDSMSVGSNVNFEVRAVCAGYWGDTASTTLAVAVLPPRVSLEGPLVFASGRLVRFRAVAVGAVPFTYSWALWIPGAWTPAGTTESIALLRSETFSLRVDARDSQGRIASDERRVRAVRLRLVGPSRATPGSEVHYAAQFDTVIAGTIGTWSMQRWCGGVPCGPAREVIGTDAEVSVTCDEDFRLRYEVVFPWGDAFAESTFVSRHGPTIQVEGPVAFGTGLHFTSIVDGPGPMWVDWFRRDGSPLAPELYVGTGSDVFVFTPPPFALRARVTNNLGQSSDTTLFQYAAVVGADGEPSAFGFTVSPLAGGGFDAMLSAPAAGPARLEVLDVGGRRMASPWAGTLAAGRRKVRVERADLPSGVYFVRFAWADRVATRRVVLVR